MNMSKTKNSRRSGPRPGAAMVALVAVIVLALAGSTPASGGTVTKKKLRALITATVASMPVIQRTNTTGSIPSGQAGEAVVNCAPGEKAIGGGFAASSGFGRVDGSRPELDGSGVPTGWRLSIGNNSPGAATFTVYVLCLKP